MGREEQIEERGVLDSIFPEEITNISDTIFRVSIALDVEHRTQDDEEPSKPSILLTVDYPPTYPDVPPFLVVSDPKDAPKSDQLLFPEDAAHLIASLDEVIHDSLGEAMIFTLISTLKDSAEALIATRVAAIQAKADEVAVQAEAKENAKFHGEAVTKERFLAWRERFLQEQREQEEVEERKLEESGSRGKKVVKEEKKMTGRERWERGLVGKIDEDGEGDEDGDDDKDALAAAEKMTIQN